MVAIYWHRNAVVVQDLCLCVKVTHAPCYMFLFYTLTTVCVPGLLVAAESVVEKVDR